MARPLRIEYAGACYHVTGRGIERRKVFRSGPDYRRFEKYMREAQQKYGYLIHSYVLMPNHYHLLIETPAANLSKVMHHIGGSYATYFNIKHRRSGHVFHGRYKALLVDRDAYLLEVSRYLHLNPVSAGLVKRPEQYPYSSYRHYTSPRVDDWVCTGLTLGMMTDEARTARRRYIEFVQEGMKVELEDPLRQAHAGLILGDEEFIRATLERIEGHVWEAEEVSQRRALRTGVVVDDVLEVITAAYGVSRLDLERDRRGEARKVAVYLLKRHTGMTNRAIGAVFGGVSYSAVAKVNERLSRQLAGNDVLRKRVRQLEQRLSRVKG
jgi:REP element-mobilizing transposase RayT